MQTIKLKSNKLSALIRRYQEAKDNGQLQDASEATMRAWIDELLSLVNGRVKFAFVDAKSLSVNIENDKSAAFQIRSYGWSIGAPFSIVTNFEQLAIYDCSVMPDIEDDANYARLYLLTYDQYEEKSETLEAFLSRSNVINGNVKLIHGNGNALDEQFPKMLGEIRKDLAKAILGIVV